MTTMQTSATDKRQRLLELLLQPQVPSRQAVQKRTSGAESPVASSAKANSAISPRSSRR